MPVPIEPNSQRRCAKSPGTCTFFTTAPECGPPYGVGGFSGGRLAYPEDRRDRVRRTGPVQLYAVARTYVDGAEREGREETLVTAQHGANNLLDVFGQVLQINSPGMVAIGTLGGHDYDERAAGVVAFGAGGEWLICVGHAGRSLLSALSET